MRRFAERRARGENIHLGRGYLAQCAECGLVVVHARKTGKPFHMHRWSRRCRELAAKRKG